MEKYFKKKKINNNKTRASNDLCGGSGGECGGERIQKGRKKIEKEETEVRFIKIIHFYKRSFINHQINPRNLKFFFSSPDFVNKRTHPCLF